MINSVYISGAHSIKLQSLHLTEVNGGPLPLLSFNGLYPAIYRHAQDAISLYATD